MVFFNNMNRIQTDDDFTYEPAPTIIHGQTDLGNTLPLAVTPEGHMEVAIHGPLLPFGSVHVENLTPVFQADAVYNIDSNSAIVTTSGTGSITVNDSAFVASTGATIYSQAVMQSRKRLRYRPGQGVVGRFTALYTSPVASSYQIVGFGHSEDGVYIGYVGTQFGILYVKRGVREQRTLTVTTGATSAASCIITLDGVAFSVPLTAASNIQRTVYEIASFTYTGWKAYPASSTTVVFVKDSVGATAGVFSFAANGTGAAASIALTKVGVASTDTFIPQSSFNIDKLDGTGSSGFEIDPTKGNVFQIDIQYLGFGAISFKVEITPETANNATWVIFHVIKLPNTLTASSFGNPSFPFTMAAYSAGSTTNLTVKCASYMGGIEGQKMLHGNRFSYYNQLTTVGAVNYQCLMTIGNKLTYSGRSNQAVINLISVSGAIKHTSPVIYYLVKNATLAGNPSFADVASNSCAIIDKAATTCTFTDSQVIWSGHLGDTGEIDHHFGNGSFNIEEVTLQPGEYVTLCARSTTGSPSYVTGSINTREDQ
jgi:hypothetical protein